MTEKEKALALFDEGKTTTSPEVKALKLKGKTRYNYYLEWQKARGASSPSLKTTSEAKVQGSKVASELELILPPSGEVNEQEKEVNEQGKEVNEQEKEVNEEGEPETPEPKNKTKEKPSDGKKPPPAMVAGQGLTFAITISTKTLMLYQIAATQQEEELTLGDFLDVCVEDTYRGRGLDLGLVKTGGNK